LADEERISEWASVQSNNYWSSTTNANNTDNAWIVNMNNGNVNNNNKSNNNNYAWPVRAGEWETPLFSFENLYERYLECRKNKRNTLNALRFEINGEENLLRLSEKLRRGTYQPSRSVCFIVDKPKMREIIAADFSDRVVHHLLVKELEKIYEPIFIHDSYACRRDRGIHRAVSRIQAFIRKGSKNSTQKLFYLHLDIRNFFVSIDKTILLTMLTKKVQDEALRWLAHIIIFNNPAKHCIIKGSRELIQHLPPHKSLFHTPAGKGLPVGNLTSQFFANVYLNELDQFVKHTLKCKYYVRYCDDFLLLSQSVDELLPAKDEVEKFLASRLHLSLNEKFVRVLPVTNGINFLGYIIRPGYILARRRVVNNLKTKLRQFEQRLVTEDRGYRMVTYDCALLEQLRAVIASYFGHLKWADTYNLRKHIVDKFSFLHEYFSFENRKIKPLYRFNESFPTIRSQYFYFSHRFKKCAVFFQAGKYFEAYSTDNREKTVLDLKPLKPNRRRAKSGFPVRLGLRNAKKVAQNGIPVVMVRETDQYMGKIKVRLPAVKITACSQ